MSDQAMQVSGNTKVLANGAIYDLDKGRIVSGANITTKITHENAIAYNRRRQEKTAHHIRQGLIRASGSVSSYEAIALGAEHLYRGVLDPTEDLEKRRKAWLSVGKQAELLSDSVQAPQNNGSSVTLTDDHVGKLLDVISQVMSERQVTR